MNIAGLLIICWRRSITSPSVIPAVSVEGLSEEIELVVGTQQPPPAGAGPVPPSAAVQKAALNDAHTHGLDHSCPTSGDGQPPGVPVASKVSRVSYC